MTFVDLSCDLGESYGNFVVGRDEEVVPFIALDPTAQGTRPYEVKLRGVPAGVQVVRILPSSTLATPKGKR